ncbi:LAMI_0F11078g1_1 [Lachancea mirantina]|uniref:LAMI_0F11078g1_1 n=1 Tax=Lachancea mirantina TaxID=1230905 RepID=A0A1G4K286_9SACH|nr:LAMI_0F11078g1_1 [Lachancea mirantina]
MAPKKRKIQETEVVVESGATGARYAAGKQPRPENSPAVEVNYFEPLDPEGELFADQNWFIPKFNLFISFTLDYLVESSRGIFKDFIKLPSRKFHPGYFYRIDQPISINEIKSRDYEYLNGQRTFLLDVELIFKNCFAYNDPESLIVKNSMQVVNFIKYEVLKAKNVTRNYLINTEVKAFLMKALKTILDATDKSIAEVTGKPQEGLDETMHICEPFMQLVDKDSFPDYYEVIHKPIALKLVKNNLDMGFYTKIYDFYIDMELVFQNALVFNNEDTLIHQDAQKLLQFFRKVMQAQFFADLKDASERGEVKLEYDKIEYEQYLANGGNENEGGLEDENGEVEDYDFNHYEGLGNGYNRTLFSGDYLLGPTKIKADDSRIKKLASEPMLDFPDETKFNLMKSLGMDYQKPAKEKSYKFISDISLSSSRSVYRQATKPAAGAMPPVNQKWVEYVFKGKDLKESHNNYTISIPPTQTTVTIVAHVNSPQGTDLESVFLVNKEKTSPAETATQAEQPQQPAPLKYELRLPEGLNCLQFSCQNLENQEKESLTLWVNVLS